MMITRSRGVLAAPCNRVALSLLGLCVLGLTACQEPLITAEEASPYVDAWSATVEAALFEQAAGAAGAAALKARIEGSGTADRAKTTRDDPPYDALLDDVYSRHEYKPVLVAQGKLTERGEAVWEAFKEVEYHLLDAQKYQVEKIEETLGRLEAKRGDYEGFDLSAGDAERAFAMEYLTERPHSKFELTEENHAELLKALLESSSGERLRGALSDYEKMSATKVAIESELEQLLAQGLVRYAREMRHFRVKEIFIHPRHDDFYNETETRSRRPDEAKGSYTAGVIWRRAAQIAVENTEANKTQILHQNIKAALEDVLVGDDARATVAGLPPQQPQYAGLVAEYKRYRKIVDAGGWEEINAPRTLNPGARTEVVKELKARLRSEGFYGDDQAIDDHYDEALTEAIREYQETHQMDVTGKPTNLFWRSLNISAERRMNQIGLNIERWRKTNIRHEDPVYAYVNISDFTVELWRNQERDMRFPVVVGSNELAINPLTEEAERANRTPTMAAYVDRVIYNPVWNVTERVRAIRIVPEVRMSVEKKYIAKMEAMRKKSAPQRVKAAALDLLANIGGATGSTESGTDGSETAGSDTAEAAPAAPQQEALYTKGKDGEPLRFNMNVVRRLQQSAGGEEEGSGPLSDEQLKKMFHYLDPATGEVDVNVTHPDHIPSWYAENNYEVVFGSATWQYTRMKAGGGNALGLVKIIFPNYDDIYFHDTPAKELFARPVRGLSHGCIRLEKPLDFAERLLTIDGQWDEARVAKILKSGDYVPIFLKRKIPVYLEYYTVRVDDEGRANFLADIYNYDNLDG
ncbi:MAG: L,D-transpeptidase family protein [Bradymonadaceae bacterium]